MAKTAEELNIIKEEVETLDKKLVELNDKELKQVNGGAHFLKDRPAKIGIEAVEIVGDTIEAEGGFEAALGVT